MQYYAIRTILVFCLELVLYRTWARLLTLKSVPVFYAIEIASFFMDLYLREVVTPVFLRVTLSWGFFYVALPIIMSEGPLRQRAGLVLFANLVYVLTEVMASAFYGLLTGGGAYPADLTEQNFGPVFVTYVMLIFVASVMFELLIAFVRYIRREGNLSLELPVLAFMLLTPLTFHLIYDSGYIAHSIPLPIMYMLLVYAVSSLVISARLVIAAKHDAEARRVLVRRRASERQLEAIKAQLEEARGQADALRRLRHDLANQVDVVGELARSGRLDEADAHLAELARCAEELRRQGGADAQPRGAGLVQGGGDS